MIWGDIITCLPALMRELPRDVIVLNWGYEPDHPFEREARRLAKSRVPFYVCPGTSTWTSLLGRHDTAFANLRRRRKQADGTARSATSTLTGATAATPSRWPPATCPTCWARP